MALNPTPRFRIHLDDLSHPGTASFLSLIDASRLLPNCLDYVLDHLYNTFPGSNVPPTRSVTLILRPIDGVAFASSIPLDDDHKEITFNLNHIQHFAGNGVRCRDEIIGVATHELTHCFQYNALGTAPSGLVEGIADFVRLKAGLAPPHWKGAKEDRGDKWDAGYQKTAYFLNWLEETYGSGTVAKINETMRVIKYDDKKFWGSIFAECDGIDVLWKKYCASFDDEEGGGSQIVIADGEANQGDTILVERRENELDDPRRRKVGHEWLGRI